jgi:hypothetical protein
MKREIAALRSTLAQVWAALVDIDDASLREETIDAVDDACEIIVTATLRVAEATIEGQFLNRLENVAKTKPC